MSVGSTERPVICPTFASEFSCTTGQLQKMHVPPRQMPAELRGDSCKQTGGIVLERPTSGIQWIQFWSPQSLTSHSHCLLTVKQSVGCTSSDIDCWIAITTVDDIWELKMVQLVQSQGMLFTTKHVMYQVKVCSRDLLVFWHFPTPSVHLYVNSQHTSRE